MENNKNDNSLEFSFETEDDAGLVFENEEGGLVFESVPHVTEKPEQSEPVAEKPVEVKAEEKKAEKVNEAPRTEDTASSEFGIPDVFEVNEKFNKPLPQQERTRIYTTYVPRFTGASDNYRMKNDPRPLPKKEELVEKLTVEAPPTEEKKIDSVKAQAVPEEKEPEPKKPEAPVSEPTESTVIVNIPEERSDSLDGESFSIFKFPEEKETEPTERIGAENANRRALEELKARQAERRAREEAERLEREANEREAARVRARVKLSPEDYRMPDPEQSTYFDKHGAKDADYDVPHGIPGDSSTSKKGSEYKRRGKRDRIKDKFLDLLVSVRIRLVLAVILSAALLFIENHTFIGLRPERWITWLSSSPSAVAIIDLQITACVLLLALPEICHAFKALSRKEVLPELSLVVSFLLLTAYTVVKVAFRYATAPDFGFILSMGVVLLLVASCLERKTFFDHFKFISSEGEKTVLEFEETRKYPRTMLALDGAVDGYKSCMAKTFRTAFVSDFFSNSTKREKNAGRNLIMLAVMLASAAVIAVITYFVSEHAAIERATAAFALVSVFSLPCITVLSHRLLQRHASREAAMYDSCVIGEEAYISNSEIDVIAFEDTEIFGEEDVNLKRFAFYGTEENMNKCMRLVASLFATVGGPLDAIFSKTVEKHCSIASDVKIEHDGISGRVDGRNVLVGTSDYMLRQGIRIPEDNDRSYGIGAESTKVMYGAESGIVFAKFFIRYSFSEEFASLLPELKDERVVPLVYTSDPNVSVELLRTLTMGADAVRVMKRSEINTKSGRVYPRLSANSVTHGDPVSTIKLVLISKKYTRIIKSVSKAECILLAGSIALCACTAIFGSIAAVPTAIFGAVGAVSALVMGLISRKKFNLSTKNKGK